MLKPLIRWTCFVCASLFCSLLALESAAEVKLSLPLTILKFNGSDLTGNSPTMFLPAKFDNEGTVTNYGSAQFQLSTVGMDQMPTGSPATSRLWKETSSNPGTIAVLDNSNSTSLLMGELMSLSLTIVNPTIGLIEGTGSFLITGGSLASQFGGAGVLETVAVSFTVPTSFGSPFAVIATSVLAGSSPGGTGPMPEASAFVVWLGLIGVVGICTSLSLRRRRLTSAT